jgi:serine phosphatase RsbU (regulator of sigma subunit)
MLYTDGLSEARNAAGEMLGEKRLLELLAQTAMQAGDAQGGKQFLLGRLADYSGQAPLADDQTLILIRHRP